MSNVPKLRFREFSGEWENKNLGDVFNIFQGYAFSSNDTTKEGVRWLKIADVGIQEMKYDTPSFLPDDFREKHSKFLLKKDDYVLALTRPILNGKLKIAKVDVTYNGSLLNQRVGKLITKQSLDFVYCLLQKSNLINKIDSFILGSEPPNLSVNQIKPIKAQVPSKQEQEKIASFLTSVDTKIEQLTKKEELLSSYKKGVMQKIFSGEIRFKADDGSEFCEWEEKKLGEIIEFLSDYTANGSFASLKENVTYYNEENYAVLVRTTDLEKKVFNPERFTDQRGYDFLKKTSLYGGEIILANVGSIGKVYKVPYYDKPMTLAPNTYVISFKKDINEDFIFQVMNMQTFTNKLLSMVGSSTLKAINKANLRSIAVDLPSIEEQTKIANFLSSIDSKIEQVQKQLDFTKEFKKALLQQMFV